MGKFLIFFISFLFLLGLGLLFYYGCLFGFLVVTFFFLCLLFSIKYGLLQSSEEGNVKKFSINSAEALTFSISTGFIILTGNYLFNNGLEISETFGLLLLGVFLPYLLLWNYINLNYIEAISLNLIAGLFISALDINMNIDKDNESKVMYIGIVILIIFLILIFLSAFYAKIYNKTNNSNIDEVHIN